MKKWLSLILLLAFPLALEVNITSSTKLEKDHAYVISAIGLSGSGTVNYISGDSTISSGGTYKLAPQVIVYDGTTKFVGSATNFTGCLNNIKYVDSVPSGGCGIVKVNNISAENIKAGVKVSYGLEGNTLTEVTGTFTSDANATASQILSGQTAYVQGEKVTGTMANIGTATTTLNPGGSYTIPAGYHNGNGVVRANSAPTFTGYVQHVGLGWGYGPSSFNANTNARMGVIFCVASDDEPDGRMNIESVTNCSSGSKLFTYGPSGDGNASSGYSGYVCNDINTNTTITVTYDYRPYCTVSYFN